MADDLGGEGDVLRRVFGLFLHINTLGVDAAADKLVADALGFGDDLVVGHAAAGHAHGLRMGGEIVVGAVDAGGEHGAGA